MDELVERRLRRLAVGYAAVAQQSIRGGRVGQAERSKLDRSRPGPSGQWQVPVPVSVKVLPAIGTKSQR